MNLAILERVSRVPALRNLALKSAKHAPEILTGFGIAGVIGGTILIARGATRLEPILDQHEARLNEAKFDLARANDELADVDYTATEVKREIAKVYARTAAALAKEFGPGITLEILSIVAILAGHGILRRRAVALLGAYKALEQTFTEYRERVVEELGEEKEKEIRYGIKTETVTDEAGKKTKQKTWNGSVYSPYARIFDESNDEYRTIPEYNLNFLRNQQAFANQKLLLQGYLFLSEVYDMLGFERTPASQVVGWVLDAKGQGDMQIDFGIYNTDVEKARDFINGLEKSIILDFNVDGPIIDSFDRIAEEHRKIKR